jgi:CubicO group peptidase (beta-lactamase class C family)
MIELPANICGDRMGELKGIGHDLRGCSAADTIAFAYGIGESVVAWHDDSDGRFFDLASLTKPLFTTPSVIRQSEENIPLDEPASTFLTWIPAQPQTPTVRQLLTHSGGLPAEIPADGGADEIQDWLSERVYEKETQRGRVLYSDLGYWLLGRILATQSRSPLQAVFEGSPSMCAGGFVFGTVPAASAVPAGPIQSDVQLIHDPAARRLGVSGHAGAFGTLSGVITAVIGWLKPTWVRESAEAEVFTCQTHRTPGGHRSLAWTMGGDPYHVVAHDWPTSTVCHTGFTGVCVALDPVSAWWAVYLSNAIPIDRDATPVLVARRHFHAVVAEHLSQMDQHHSISRGRAE